MVEQSEIRGRFAIILVVAGLLLWALQANSIKLGQDLRGGTTLRFSLDLDKAIAAKRIDADRDPAEVVTETIAVIQDRIDKFGLSETQILPLGDDKFQITLPVGSEPGGIIRIVTQLGDLKFRIEVRPDDHYRRYAQDEGRLDELKRQRVWPGNAETFEAHVEAEIKHWKQARADGLPYKPTNPRFELVKERGTDGSMRHHFHLLEVPTAGSNEDFDGAILKDPVVRQDPNSNRPVVDFDVRNEYQNVFGDWTEKNMLLPMAIVLNDEYFSAPWINNKLSTNVRISLGAGSPGELEKEAKALTTVLQTGALKVQPTLEAKNEMGATLAGESRDRGIMAVIVAFLLVLVFMVVYYRGSGVVANVALLLNLVLLVGFLAFFKAVLTLPGIAGIVLTVGMAVDANILINERIREELRGGRSLRRAISEGYDRALSAIVDANVTSIITAIFLYNFGSGPVRGFAITLALGLMVSMFTAIYVTRTIFEWLLSHGKMQKMSMWGSGEPPKINWIKARRLFAPISIAGVVFGLIMFASTDKYTLYDVDFTGGYKVQMAFHQPTTVDEVKEALRGHAEVDVMIGEYDENNDLVEKPVKVKAGGYDSAQVLAIEGEGLKAEVKVQRLFEEADGNITEEARSKAFTAFLKLALADRLLPDRVLLGPSTYVHPTDSEDEALKAVDRGLYLRVALRDPGGVVTPEALQVLLKENFPHFVQGDGGRMVPRDPTTAEIIREVVVREAPEQPKGARAFDTWIKNSNKATSEVLPTDLEDHRDRLSDYFGSEKFRRALTKQVRPGQTGTPLEVRPSGPFSSTDVIGSSVAHRLKNDAIVALILSLIGIIAYIAIRFRSSAMGFAAVLCLFHDVAITLGLVAVANSLGIVDAKINLAMVAAFLTLVGYSVNDTVVIFDRIRENRGKRPTIDSRLINVSINQTLARTIKTSITFLLVCLALFIFNYGQRNVLEGFSFLLILGSIIGTYSTVAISSPLLLYLPWLWQRIKGYAPMSEMVTKCASNVATIVFTPVVAVLYAAWWAAFGAGAFLLGLVLFVPWAMSDSDIEEPVAATLS